jgi:hypothetical protein
MDRVPGKEDIFKLLTSGRKMMQHLEKVNVNQKSMLMEFHRRTDELKESNKTATLEFILKLVVVISILVGQFLAVRQMFQ